MSLMVSVVDDMCSVDVEWLFLRVREKSVGEEVKAYRCGEDGWWNWKAVIDLSKIGRGNMKVKLFR